MIKLVMKNNGKLLLLQKNYICAILPVDGDGCVIHMSDRQSYHVKQSWEQVIASIGEHV